MGHPRWEPREDKEMAGKSASSGTVGKALEVLDTVAAVGHPVRFGELLADSPHPKATLYRFLQTLTQEGMLSYDPDQQTYSLGLRLVRLAHEAWKQSTLAPIAKPILDALLGEVREAIHLAQLENGQVLFIEKRRLSKKFDTLAQVGTVAPAYCTGVGKAILAFMTPERQERAILQQSFFKYTPQTHGCADTLIKELAQIRAQGVAFDREEHESGIISIAAPIITSRDRVIGAISIATSTERHSLAGLETFRPALLNAAKQIGDAASSWQRPN